MTSYFTDETGIRISNEKRIIADSISTQAAARTFKEKFVFQSVHDDSNRTYYLIMEDTKTGIEYDKYIVINIKEPTSTNKDACNSRQKKPPDEGG